MRTIRIVTPSTRRAPREATEAVPPSIGGSGGPTFELYTEQLLPSEPRYDDSPLEPLFKAPVADLHAMLPAVLDELDGWLTEEFLEELAERIHTHLERGDDEAVHSLDVLRSQLKGLRGRLGYLYSTERFDRLEILRCLAERRFLELAVDTVLTAQRHTVFIEVLKVGWSEHLESRPQRPGGLIASLARLYADERGEVEEVCLRSSGGGILEGLSERDRLDQTDI